MELDWNLSRGVSINLFHMLYCTDVHDVQVFIKTRVGYTREWLRDEVTSIIHDFVLLLDGMCANTWGGSIAATAIMFVTYTVNHYGGLHV